MNEESQNRRPRPRGIDEFTNAKLDTLARWMHEAECVVWFTGAGISTESGLPDYRGPNGVWTRKRKGLPRPKMKRPFEEIQPNAAHLAIVELEKIGKCAFLISQNVDNLHLKSGFPPEKLAELHGNKTRFRCRPCGQTYPISDFISEPEQRRGPRRQPIPYNCPTCGRRLERSVINFGDPMPREDLDAAFQWARRADLIVVVGSSCFVTPAADVPAVVKKNGGRVVIINLGKTGIDDICDLRFRDVKAGILLPRLLEIVTTG